MCGIAGVSLKYGDVHDVLLESFSEALAHRGPDGEGFYMQGDVGLVHRRLSIIDVAGGAQPISDAENKVHIIGNGEIYNYCQLQHDLEQEGTVFKTHSDTESALHLYKKHGASFVRHMYGMYAVAVYDETQDKLILARDPLGIKPLYYAETSVGFAFASEPAALVRSGWVKAEVEKEVLPSFFNRQYVTGRKTMFKGIYRVLPGEMIVVQKGVIKVKERLAPRNMHVPEKIAYPQAKEQFEEKFNDVVREHLQSEVAYGVFLSGGIDSSAVTLKTAELATFVRSFTIGFESKTVNDERSSAEEMSELLKNKHTSISFAEDDFWNILPEMCFYMDDLVADYAALPLLSLARRASKDVKVVLSGEGGDEFFAGYGRYRPRFWKSVFSRSFRGRGDAHKFKGLFSDEISSWVEKTPYVPFGTKKFTSLQNKQVADIVSWLPDDLLIKVDRCLMAYGIEGRVPFVDERIAGFGFSLPDKCKLRGKQGKFLLKDWLAGKLKEMKSPLAEDVWEKKSGFTVPIHDWMEKRRSEISNYLSNHEAILGVTHRKKLLRLLGKSFTKKSAKMIFTLLCYALWYDIHIAGKKADENFLKREAHS